MRPFLTVGELARKAGVKPSTVRYYEARGIVPKAQRLPNGYRLFADDAVAWLRFVRRAQSFGMTLEEIRGLVEFGRTRGKPCERLRDVARDRLREVDRKIAELLELRRSLERLLRRRGGRAAPDEVCPLLAEENISAGALFPLPSARPGRGPRLRRTGHGPGPTS
ncbi:MAG: HTH-type transcriptional regulator HmrR [Candidatus Binatia bacterium]|nr:MAG: HTH-type transcriptional regulator HmrR [Candidatus Binatia bacterium]